MDEGADAQATPPAATSSSSPRRRSADPTPDTAPSTHFQKKVRSNLSDLSASMLTTRASSRVTTLRRKPSRHPPRRASGSSEQNAYDSGLTEELVSNTDVARQQVVDAGEQFIDESVKIVEESAEWKRVEDTESYAAAHDGPEGIEVEDVDNGEAVPGTTASNTADGNHDVPPTGDVRAVRQMEATAPGRARGNSRKASYQYVPEDEVASALAGHQVDAAEEEQVATCTRDATGERVSFGR
eukprot:3480335-Prymnesium_polylepis.1